MRPPEFTGYWYCARCGARLWAKAVLEDRMSYPPCPTCQVG